MQERASIDVRVVHRSESCVIAVYGPVLLQHWFGRVTMEDAESTLRAHKLARASGRGRVCVLVAVDGLQKMPAPDVRDYLSGLAAETQGEVYAHATVIRAQGFVASTIRSVLMAIFAASRSDYPKKVFAELSAAARWLEERSEGIDATLLESAFVSLVSVHDDAPSG